MSQPHDWDAEERARRSTGLMASWPIREGIRMILRSMLRAAEADALPPEITARVTRHLQDSV